MDHAEHDDQSIGAMLSSIAEALREVGDKLDAVAARVDQRTEPVPMPRPDRPVPERLDELEAWAFRAAQDISRIDDRLNTLEGSLDSGPESAAPPEPTPPSAAERASGIGLDAAAAPTGPHPVPAEPEAESGTTERPHLERRREHRTADPMRVLRRLSAGASTGNDAPQSSTDQNSAAQNSAAETSGASTRNGHRARAGGNTSDSDRRAATDNNNNKPATGPDRKNGYAKPAQVTPVRLGSTEKNGTGPARRKSAHTEPETTAQSPATPQPTAPDTTAADSTAPLPAEANGQPATEANPAPEPHTPEPATPEPAAPEPATTGRDTTPALPELPIRRSSTVDNTPADTGSKPSALTGTDRTSPAESTVPARPDAPHRPDAPTPPATPVRNGHTPAEPASKAATPKPGTTGTAETTPQPTDRSGLTGNSRTFGFGPAETGSLIRPARNGSPAGTDARPKATSDRSEEAPGPRPEDTATRPETTAAAAETTDAAPSSYDSLTNYRNGNTPAAETTFGPPVPEIPKPSPAPAPEPAQQTEPAISQPEPTDPAGITVTGTYRAFDAESAHVDKLQAMLDELKRNAGSPPHLRPE